GLVGHRVLLSGLRLCTPSSSDRTPPASQERSGRPRAPQHPYRERFSSLALPRRAGVCARCPRSRVTQTFTGGRRRAEIDPWWTSTARLANRCAAWRGVSDGLLPKTGRPAPGL